MSSNDLVLLLSERGNVTVECFAYEHRYGTSLNHKLPSTATYHFKCTQQSYINYCSADRGLSDLPHEVEDVILKLDAKCPRTVKNWFDVGRKLGISPDDLNMIKREDDRQGGSPTKELLEKLLTQETVPTLRKFVAVLQEIGRHDIANGICEWYKNNNLNVTNGIVLTV